MKFILITFIQIKTVADLNQLYLKRLFASLGKETPDANSYILLTKDARITICMTFI